MFETIFALSILSLIILSLRNRSKPTEKPVIVQRPGVHCISMAPKLYSAKRLLEKISAEYHKALSSDMKNVGTEYFLIRDSSLWGDGLTHYLMAITAIDGILHIQAIVPKDVGQVGVDELTQIEEASYAALHTLNAPHLTPRSGVIEKIIMNALSDLTGISAIHYVRTGSYQGKSTYSPTTINS